MSDEQTLEQQVQELRDQLQTFTENPFLRSLPGRIIALESFAEAVFTAQAPEEQNALLDMTESISSKRWEEAFPDGSLSDIEALAALRAPLVKFIASLRNVRKNTLN